MSENNDYSLILRRGAEYSATNEKLRTAVKRMADNIAAAFGGNTRKWRDLPRSMGGSEALYYIDGGTLYCMPDSRVMFGDGRYALNSPNAPLAILQMFAGDVANHGILALWVKELERVQNTSLTAIAICEAVNEKVDAAQR